MPGRYKQVSRPPFRVNNRCDQLSHALGVLAETALRGDFSADVVEVTITVDEVDAMNPNHGDPSCEGHQGQYIYGYVLAPGVMVSIPTDEASDV